MEASERVPRLRRARPARGRRGWRPRNARGAGDRRRKRADAELRARARWNGACEAPDDARPGSRSTPRSSSSPRPSSKHAIPDFRGRPPTGPSPGLSLLRARRGRGRLRARFVDTPAGRPVHSRAPVARTRPAAVLAQGARFL